MFTKFSGKMNVICSICSDPLVQTDDIFYTRCGHVFHLQCLNAWLERSKSCPQCREKVTQSKIHRLYFTFANNEIVESQASTLQDKIDGLKFQILLKEKDIQYYTSKNVTLEKQNAGLRQEVYKLEAEINQKNSAIHALKEQIEYFKKRSSKSDNLKKEITQLKDKLEDLKPLQALLHGPLSDVSRMIGNDKDPDTLIKFISIMKKELIGSFNNCKQLRMTVKRLREELSLVNAKLNSLLEEQSKQTDLEEGPTFSHSQNRTLQSTDNELEEIHEIHDKSSNVSEIQEMENDIFKQQPVEVKTKKDKSNKESLGKNVIPVKRKKHKTSICRNNDEDKNEYKVQGGKTETDSIHSDTDTKWNSSNDSPTVSKKCRMSDNNINTSDTSNVSSSSVSKKKKKHSTKIKVPNTEDDACSVIDLT